MRDTVLAADHLTVRFDVSASWLTRLFTRASRRTVHAVEDVSFEIDRGTTFALVGESGCGKSTIARTIAGIQRPTSGAVSFMDADIAGLRSRSAVLPYKRNLQMVFQDPYASLNPRWRVGGSAPAHVDRACDPVQSRLHRLRRADIGARRFRAGANPQPDVRPPAAVGADLSADLAQSRRCGPHGRRTGRDVFRPTRRAGRSGPEHRDA